MQSLNITRWFPLLILLIASIDGVTLVYLSIDNFSIALTDGIITALIFTATTWVGISSLANYPTRAGVLVYSLLIGLAVGVATWYIDKVILSWWYDDNKKYILLLEHTGAVRFLLSVLASCWIVTFIALQKQVTTMDEEYKNTASAVSLHREAELFKLRQQLQPHFLYNSLNSINALILIEPDKAQEMVGKLSDFLRNSLKREAREHIPVDEELEYIEAYLAIETVRFGNRLEIVYHKGYTDDAVIPPFLLQPIIENAIKFGLYGKTGNVVIDVNISLEAKMLSIAITNPYEPNHKPPSGTGFGLEGIARRLYLLYARNDLLTIKKDGTLFTTTLKIPQADV